MWESGLVDEPDPANRLSLLSGVIAVHALHGEDVVHLLAELEQLAGRVSDPRATGTLPGTRALVAFFSGRLAEARERSPESSPEDLDNSLGTWSKPPGQRCGRARGLARRPI